MPRLSAVELPACCTASWNPCTAGRLALAMISRSVSFASFSVSRAMMNPLRPNFTSRRAARACSRTSTTCSVTPAKSLPLEKYQSA